MDYENTRTAEDIINEKGSEIFCVSPNTIIHDALKIMNEKKIGAILIEDAGKICGIWTERDLMQDLILPGFDPKTAKIGDYMTKQLKTCSNDTPVYKMADMLLGLRIRHLIVERDGKHIGLLSAGDIIRAGLQFRTEEWKELDRIVRLKFYDEWKWQKKK
jgi:signal-transduction protein with cAMP-binding, CBS, and nucleotidyltransferase domain